MFYHPSSPAESTCSGTLLLTIVVTCTTDDPKDLAAAQRLRESLERLFWRKHS